MKAATARTTMPPTERSKTARTASHPGRVWPIAATGMTADAQATGPNSPVGHFDSRDLAGCLEEQHLAL